MTCRPGEPLTEGHTGGEGTSDAERREQRRHAAGDLVAQHRVQTPIQSQTRQKWSDTGNGDDERRDQSAAGHQTTGEADHRRGGRGRHDRPQAQPQRQLVDEGAGSAGERGHRQGPAFCVAGQGIEQAAAAPAVTFVGSCARSGSAA